MLEIESSWEEVPQVALLVLQPLLGQGLLVQQAKMAPGMGSSARAVEAEQVVLAHILGSPPMLLLREDEARSILETLQSTGSQPALRPIQVTLVRQTSCLVAPVALEQLR